jgi:broad specificity phosphatase PhoE
MPPQHVFLVRHGETEWTLNGRHTGTTDIPLTENGRRVARTLRPALAGKNFDLVLTSPLSRARETCELAGLGDRCELDPDLVEWNYGEYEGLTPEEIHARNPRWLIFQDGCPGGENPARVAARVDRVISRVRSAGEYVAIFAHGHLLRSLAPRWLGFPVVEGRRFLLDPATLSILSYYRDIAAIQRWNAPVSM